MKLIQLGRDGKLKDGMTIYAQLVPKLSTNLEGTATAMKNVGRNPLFEVRMQETLSKFGMSPSKRWKLEAALLAAKPVPSLGTSTLLRVGEEIGPK